MKKYKYADPSRKTHLKFIELLSERYENTNVRTIGFGDKTQHIFVSGVYQMTINWNLV